MPDHLTQPPGAGDHGARPKSPLAAADVRLAELRAQFPHWNIWFVPRAMGPTVWCGQPKPLLNCLSPDDLVTEIREVDAERGVTGQPDSAEQ